MRSHPWDPSSHREPPLQEEEVDTSPEEEGSSKWVDGLCGGNPVAVAEMNLVRSRRRMVEDHTGASGLMSEIPWRWDARAEALAGQ